ncbi:MAG: hypothetical protein LBG75_03475 [Candidatus Nomurabacteria bacterium]|jgi:hypothetical protein|nr:hypothetical protein [Candidatus Nomurabacteria bacterium]
MNGDVTAIDLATVISAVATAVAAVMAVIAAIQSHKAAKESRETNEQLIRPHISVYIQQSQTAPMSFVDIVVKNDGGGVARSIKFDVLDDGLELTFQYNGKTKISDLNFIRDGIELLSQGEKRTYLLMQISNSEHYNELFKKNVVINVSYTNGRGKKQYHDSFRLDFNSLPEIELADENTKAPKNIVKELKNINKHFDHMQRVLRYSTAGIAYQEAIDESMEQFKENKKQEAAK